jgi:NAD(P)-dependent dehydrogenase (short-subunit alcohol dehydrogenase family)
MKTVVVTGSTRGIGRGLAEAFLARNCNVVVSGRGEAAVERAVAELQARHPGRVAGAACDITRLEQIERLWQLARERFGRVDVWINNAGMSIRRVPLHQARAEDVAAIVATNLTGTLLANRVAIAGMLAQGGGQVWNMEGFGSNGMTQPGIIPYGCTKRAIRYLNAALQKELKGTPVQVCTLSPGIVVTDLLVGDYDRDSADWARAKRVFNILGDTVETVTPWLADRVLASDQPGATVAWLTTGKILGRFMSAGWRKRDLFAAKA